MRFLSDTLGMLAIASVVLASTVSASAPTIDEIIDSTGDRAWNGLDLPLGVVVDGRENAYGGEVARGHAQTLHKGGVTSVDSMSDGLRGIASAAIERDAYGIKSLADRGDFATYEAINRANGIQFTFDRDGIDIAPHSRGESDWRLRMTLSGIGYQGDVHAIHASSRALDMQADGARIEYHHSLDPDGAATLGVSIVEWYDNNREGLEQGFTLTAPPERPPATSSGLRIELEVGGDLSPRLTDNGQAIEFTTAAGRTALRYSHLHVFDTTGRELPARLARHTPTGVAIVVDDRDAIYPVTVDPLFDTEVKLTASDGAQDDEFGFSVSMSADTAIVGAFFDDDTSGAAYIFRRDEGGPDNWGEVTKLTASDAAPDDRFGVSVSISGDTVIVGAYFDDDYGSDSGSAYIFQRDQGGPDNWGEVAKLTASDASASDYFGQSVSISGDTVVVGASNSSAYVFERDHGGPDNWGEVTILTASDPTWEGFGASVSISVDTVVVGSIFGSPLEGGNSAYVFERDQGGPDNWGEVAILTGSDTTGSDRFGTSVSVSGDTAIVGASEDDDDGSDSGSAYVFQRDQGGPDNWGEVTKLTASDAAAGDEFGHSVSVDGNTVIVGAWFGDSGVADSGSAYVFQRDQGGSDNWGELIELNASDAAADDWFGLRVSISGYTAIVGAPRDDDAASASGSAYIYYYGGVPGVPVVSEWGLMVMMALVLTVGALGLARRRSARLS